MKNEINDLSKNPPEKMMQNGPGSNPTPMTRSQLRPEMVVRTTLANWTGIQCSGGTTSLGFFHRVQIMFAKLVKYSANLEQ